MAKISSDFLKELQPQLCGSAAFSYDDPWCSTDPEPLDFDAYQEGFGTKYRDILPFWDEDVVHFCQQFQKTPILADEMRRCVPLAQNVRTQLQRVVDAMPGKDGAPANAGIPPTDMPPPTHMPGTLDASTIPSPAQLYNLLRDEQLPPSRRFDEFFRRRAQQLYQQLQKIAALKAAGDPAIEGAIMDLQDEATRICVVSNPEALGDINDACAQILTTHGDMKTWYQKGIAFITGLGATTVYLIKTNLLPKMWTAGRNQWRKSRTVDPKTNKPAEGRFWATIKTIGAFFSASDPYASQYPYPSDPYQQGGYYPSYTPMEGAPQTGGQYYDPMSPIVVAGDDAVSQTDTGLYYQDDVLVSNMRKQATEIIRALGQLAQHPQSTERFTARVAQLHAALEKTANLYDRNALAVLIPMIMDEKTLAPYEEVARTFSQWVVRDRLALIAAESRATLSTYEQGNIEDAQKHLEKILQTHTHFSEQATEIRLLSKALENAMNAVQDVFRVNEDQYERHALLRERWTRSLKDVRGAMHDIAGLAQQIALNTELAQTRITDNKVANVKEILQGLGNYDLSELPFTIDFIRSLNKNLALSRDIDVRVSAVPNLLIPDTGELRFDLFRILNELVINAIKYANTEASDPYVQILITREGNLLRIVVEDNGVGIRDINQVLTAGVRERPELAEGHGEGLSTIDLLRQEHGFTMRIESTVGEGSRFILEKDVSGWEAPPPNGTPGRGGANDGNGGITSNGSSEREQASGATPRIRSRCAGWVDDPWGIGKSANGATTKRLSPAQLQHFFGDDAVSPFDLTIDGTAATISDPAKAWKRGAGVFVGTPGATGAAARGAVIAP